MRCHIRVKVSGKENPAWSRKITRLFNTFQAHRDGLRAEIAAQRQAQVKAIMESHHKTTPN